MCVACYIIIQSDQNQVGVLLVGFHGGLSKPFRELELSTAYNLYDCTF